MEVDPTRGRRIAKMREEAGYTQQQLTDQLSLGSVRTVQNWEYGGKISYPNLVALARALDVEIDVILEGDPPPGAKDETVDDRLARIEGGLLRIVRTEIVTLRDFVKDAVTGLAQGVEGLTGQVGELHAAVAGQTAAFEAVAAELPALRSEIRTLREDLDKRLPEAKGSQGRRAGGGRH